MISVVFVGIAIGGDVFPGSTLSDHCCRYQNIKDIKMIVVLGELGGYDEYSLVGIVSKASHQNSIKWRSLPTRVDLAGFCHPSIASCQPASTQLLSERHPCMLRLLHAGGGTQDGGDHEAGGRLGQRHLRQAVQERGAVWPRRRPQRRRIRVRPGGKHGIELQP